MKHLISGFIAITYLSFSFSVLAQEQPFLISGKITTQGTNDKVFLQYSYNKNSVKDSFTVTNGAFEFKGNIANPLKAQISMPSLGKSGSSVDFFIEPNITTNIAVTGKLKNAIITGGSVQNDYNLLKEMTTAHDEKYALLIEDFTRLREAKDDEGIKKLDSRFEALDKEKKQVIKTFITQKPTSFVSFSSVLDISYMIDDEFLNLYDLLGQNHKESSKGKELALQIEKTKKSFVGQTIIPFTQKDTSDTDFSISALSGKYVLIDFWASWCGPCRRENPNIVKAYNSFKDKNFEILGVSLDNKRDPWIAAIKKDELPWYHVSDLKGWKNEVSELFGIRSIPQNLLINPEGKIIARNIAGNELEETLNRFLKVN